jgi:uncharacterized cupredoxin-like copper-binding protein
MLRVKRWRRTPRFVDFVAVFAATTLLAGCGSSSHSTAAGRVIGVSERDFRIAVQTDRVTAGAYVLRVHNGGPDQHELIVAPARRSSLPVRADGFTVNEEALQSSEPGSVEPQQPGATIDLHVELKPGRYVLFCNMAGHFMAGMHVDLVVTG